MWEIEKPHRGKAKHLLRMRPGHIQATNALIHENMAGVQLAGMIDKQAIAMSVGSTLMLNNMAGFTIHVMHMNVTLAGEHG
jgi:hypothetical protein